MRKPTSIRSSKSRNARAHRVKLFMEQINQHEKTLVFCATQVHALAVRDLINQMKTRYRPELLPAGDRQRRRNWASSTCATFQDNEKTIPTILTTSQKLSTGVDARNIRNIVLMRPINSMIEFKQIIGRGTRLYDGKDYFTIYDFVKAHHHFNDPEWDGEPIEPEPKTEGRPGPPSPPSDDESHETSPDYVKRQKIKVKLADGKARTIQHMMVTSFWHPRWHADVGATVPGNAFWEAPRVFQRRGRTPCDLEPSGHASQTLRRTRREGLWT